MSEKIWYENPIFYLTDSELVTKFIPSSKMTIEQQMNAIFRFSLYFSIIVFIIKRDYKIFYLPLFVGFLTFILYKYNNEGFREKDIIMDNLNIGVEKNTQKYCVKPTKDNPFMNVMYDDYKEFPNKPPACKSYKKIVKEEIEKNFEVGYNRHDDDIFRKDGSGRQFYTNPITTIPNDQETFAKWLYTPKLLFKKQTQ